MSEEPEDPERRFLGAGLIAVGGLMVVLCGGCTLYFLGSLDWAVKTGEPGAGAAPFIAACALFFGGAPTIIGVLILRRGLVRRRAARPPPSPPPPP